MNFRHLGIRSKLMLSMGVCLLVFIAISSTLSISMTSAQMRERVVGNELPAQVSAIRNDIQRQIAEPAAISQTLAHNTFLQAWEDAGNPDDGLAAWTAQTRRLYEANHADTVFWVSDTT